MKATKPHLLGAFGPWFDEDAAGQARDFSFLDPRWRDPAVWSAEARKLFASLVSSPPLPSRPVVETVGRRSFEGLEIEELSWSLPWGPPTKAFFLKPEGARGRLPGVLAFHDHGSNKYFGKEKIASIGDEVHPIVAEIREKYYGGSAWANECAKRGFGVLVGDLFMFGSRRIVPSELPGDVVRRLMSRPEELRELEPAARSGEAVRDRSGGASCPDFDVGADQPSAAIEKYNAFASQYETIVAKSLFSSGRSWPGVFLAEDSFALDYLCSRPDIDPSRIGCGGLSGGGLRTNYLAGTDSRVACSVTAGFMSTWRDFARRSAFTHTWMLYIPGLPRRMDFPEILGMRAPSPSLVLATKSDPLFDLAEVHEAERLLRGIYEKASAPERFRMTYREGPHKFDVPMQEEAFDWFERWL